MEMGKRKLHRSRNTFGNNKKNIILGVLLLIVIIAVVFFQLSKNFYSNIYTGKSGTQTKNKTQYSILLMGYGGGNHEGAYLTDSMMVITIDTEKKKAIFVSLPRDIWSKLPIEEGGHGKLNSIYQMGLFPKNYPSIPEKYRGEQGSADMIKTVVGYILGLDIDYYLTIDFSGFTRVVDTLGGIDVVVQKSFDDWQYPIEGKKDDTCGKVDAELEQAILEATESPELAFPCRFQHLHFDAGKQHMDGQTALKFVRSRHSAEDGGDFARASRQQVFLEAVKAKVLSIGFISKIIPLVNELDNHIRTDLPFDLLQKGLKEYTDTYMISSVLLSTDNYLQSAYSENRQYILQPKAGIDNWTEVRKAVKNEINGISPIPSKSLIDNQ